MALTDYSTRNPNQPGMFADTVRYINEQQAARERSHAEYGMMGYAETMGKAALIAMLGQALGRILRGRP